MSALLSHASLGALLLAAAWADVRLRRIPNALCVALLVCGAAASCLDPGAPPPRSSAAASGLVLLVTAAAWRLGACGGGDAKLAAAAASWVGISRLPAFALATALAGGALSIACHARSAAAARRAVRPPLAAASAGGLSATPPVQAEIRRSVPYGAALAAGAWYSVFASAP